MTSQINPNNIDGQYPVAGQPNNTQGFRDNFTNIKTNFQTAATEITDLENKGVFKAALTGTTLDNNMADNLIYAVKLNDVSYTYVQQTATAGAIPIDYSAGQYQLVAPTANISLNFTNWPASGSEGVVYVDVVVTNTAYTVTLPAAVSVGITGVQGLVPTYNTFSPYALAYSIITFGATGTYRFAFSTADVGVTIAINDLNRALSYYTNPVTIANTLVSTSITSGALTVAGGVGVAGNLYVGGNIVGNLTVASQTFTGNLAAGNVNTGGQLSAAGNVTGGNVITNLVTASTLSLSGNVLTPLTVTSNITGGNVVTGGVVSATGNVSGSYFIGNGSQLTGITVSAGTALVNGTSNVKVNASGGNATVSIGGTSNVVVWATTGEYVTGVVSASGNITGANVNTAGGITAASLAVGGTIYATGTVSAIGNITTSGRVSATGNITGSYILGNGALLSGISTSSRIVSGTTELAIEEPSGNMQASIGGTANVVVFSPLGANIKGYANITSNLTSNGNATINGFISANGNITTSTGLISAPGNVTGGNLLTSGIISATGNLTCGFINATGNVSLTGNVIAGNLTTSTGAMVAVGNIKGGNLLTDGSVSALTETTIPPGGSAGKGYLFGTTYTTNFGVFFGSGVPTLAAAKGSLYLRSDGSTTNDRMYVNTNGSTVWTAVITAA